MSTVLPYRYAAQRPGVKLRSIKIFSDLDLQQLDSLAGGFHWRKIKARSLIAEQREVLSDVLFVVKGVVRVMYMSYCGREIIFRDLAAGDMIGCPAEIDGEPLLETVTAQTDATIGVMSGQAFRQLIYSEAKVARAIMKALAAEVRLLKSRVIEFSTMTVPCRIQAEILRLALQGQREGDQVTISPAPVHAEIASWVSTHREAVTRELNDLTRKGIVQRRNGALVILDLAKLVQLVDEARGAEAGTSSAEVAW